MNCHLSGAIPCTGGAQKRAGGVAGAKYSNVSTHTLNRLCEILDCNLEEVAVYKK